MEMIKIENKEGKQVVSAREVHLFLDIKTKFADWVKRCIDKYDFVENTDYSILRSVENHSTGATTKIDYIVTLDMAKELAMISDTKKGKEARKYFIECEKKLNLNKVPTTYLEALREIIKIEEEKVSLQNKVAILTHVNKLYTSSEIAKELNMRSANEFNKILSDLKIQYKVNNTWVLTAKYSNLGYESIKQNVLDNGKVVYDRKFTQLGRDFILELFKIGGIKC